MFICLQIKLGIANLAIWRKEHLHQLESRTKWQTQQQRNMKIGDVVLVKSDNERRNIWKMGLVAVQRLMILTQIMFLYIWFIFLNSIVFIFPFFPPSKNNMLGHTLKPNGDKLSTRVCKRYEMLAKRLFGSWKHGYLEALCTRYSRIYRAKYIFNLCGLIWN